MFSDNGVTFYSLDGGRNMQQSSGLISKSEYENKFGFILVDLKKYNSAAEWISPQAISVQGVNNSRNTITYTYTLFSEKDITIDMTTGKIVV